MRAHGEADIASALGQVAYTADELEMLVPLLARVPVTVLSTPIPSSHAPEAYRTLAAMFGAIAERDEALAEALGAGRMPDREEWKSTSRLRETSDEDATTLVALAADNRRRLVGVLEEAASRATGPAVEPLVARLFELIHDDAEILRDVAYALHAGPVTRAE